MSRIYDALPIAWQNVACSYAGFRRSQVRFSRHFRRTLAEWERTGAGDLRSLHEIQWRRLRQLVERAQRFVPHYQGLRLDFGSDEMDPEERIHHLLAQIPVLEKAEYRDSPETFIASDIRRRRLRPGKTGGTTGTALPLWYNPEAIAEEYVTVWRLRRSCGVEVDDPNITFGGQIIVPFDQSEPPFWRRNAWGRQTLFSLYHMTPANMPAYVDAIHEVPARYVQGYPSSLSLVGRAMLEMGRPLPPGHIEAVFTSSESLLAYHRKTIETAFNAPVFDRYGASEFCVSMTACPRNRLHVDMEFCIVEVDAQEEDADSVRGPVIVTGLSNQATPFIRYVIGDVGTRLKGPCSCGRAGEVFLDIDGRLDDYVVTPDGRHIGRLDHIFKEQLDVAEAQILQDTEAYVTFKIVPRPSYSDNSRRKLLREIRARLGNEIGVDIQLVDSIPRGPNGKFRAVESRVGRVHG